MHLILQKASQSDEIWRVGSDGGWEFWSYITGDKIAWVGEMFLNWLRKIIAKTWLYKDGD